jgi:antibiotic biosynthesis monooxygenase (ABM) superfamily enzyme
MAAEASNVPTVVVARRVFPGVEEDFRSWDRRIRAAAQQFAGYLGSEMQPPSRSHPGEWVTVYSFATVEQLERWLNSPERKALMDESDAFVAGPAREQRMAALPTAPDPVTVVFSQRIALPNQGRFQELYQDVVDQLHGVGGFLGSELLPPVGDIQEDHVIVASFATRDALDAWLDSPARAAWLAEVETLIEGERTMNVVGGFGGWFPAQATRPRGPKRWKQAVAVLIALFPTTLTITLVRREIAPDMNVVLAVFVGNVLGVLALSYFLMPWLTRRLRAWLER